MTQCTGCGHLFATTHMKNGRAHKCCPDCRERSRAARAAVRAADPDALARYLRERRRGYRKAAFDAYGGVCACCGEGSYEFLTIDHPDGGGRREREENSTPAGSTFAQWLARQGYPPGYRVLCHNCNSAYGYYGYCPHQTAVGSHAEFASVARRRTKIN